LEICAIMVTHDQSEALAVADQLLLLQNGRIVQQGTPQEIYSEPNCFYSADFLGANNVIKGKILSTKGNVVTLGGENWSIEGVSVQNGNLRRDDSGHAVIRIEKIDLSGSYAPEGIEMQLDDNIFLGDRWEYRFHRGDLSLKAFGAKPIQSKQVWAKVPNEAVWVFSEQ
jgi:iron(III) transport system ATP-binding protein